MAVITSKTGSEELRRALRPLRPLLVAVCVFSIVVNALLLTGPLFMLEVYDRVLPSGSAETLLLLFALVTFLYVAKTLLDIARNRILARVGAQFQTQLERRVFRASLAAPVAMSRRDDAPLDDLATIARAMASPVTTTMIDLPFAPLFLVGMILFHPLLGFLAVLGGACLLGLTQLHRMLSAHAVRLSQDSRQRVQTKGALLHQQADMVLSLGAQENAYDRWFTARTGALTDTLRIRDQNIRFESVVRTLRMFLQSAVLATGAYLVLMGEMSAGGMIASSILFARVLQPVDNLVTHLPIAQDARRSWQALTQFLSDTPETKPAAQLPRPQGSLTVSDLTLFQPDRTAPALDHVSFTVVPGQALGVIGSSGAGKSTLARALTGTTRPRNGSIRLGGYPLEQFDANALGALIGYLPQTVTLFEATIAENIAKLAVSPDMSAVTSAAKAANAHDLILSLPQGYETRVHSACTGLSGGQIQRIALARALYGDPLLLVLDEPNSNLDHGGSIALNSAIRAHKARGGIVLIMAHRPSIIQECDLMLVLENGKNQAFGPRDAVLQKLVENSREILAFQKRAEATGT